MKKAVVLIAVAALYLMEIVALILFAVATPNFTQDTVSVNEIVQSVAQNFGSVGNYQNESALDFVVLDKEGGILYRTKEGLSETVNAAISHRDTVLDIVVDGEAVGKVIIYSDGAKTLQAQKRTAIIVLSVAIAVQCAICIGYGGYLYLTVIRPFGKLKGFAERVAGGNLDIPLEMDRGNLFGAFTESFDLMRTELKKARMAEAEAEQSKKELVAKLSHDIKTPIASVKAVSEVGLAVTENEKDRENYEKIMGKADQINALVTNLFTATLEELHQLTVTPVRLDARRIKTLLENADYLHRATLPELPECRIYADPLRLQQVFDNIFANSYKYANTEIRVRTQNTPNQLGIIVEDFGGGVPEEELPVLKEKFKRGNNAKNIEGAGLGLYVSDYFMREMQGELQIENGAQGLRVTVVLSSSGNN